MDLCVARRPAVPSCGLPGPDEPQQSVCSRLVGDEDMNDAEQLSQDLTFPLIVSEKGEKKCAGEPGSQKGNSGSVGFVGAQVITSRRRHALAPGAA
jgi:hypothetical protein